MSFIGAKPSQTLATPTSQYFNGTGSQTVFTLNRAVNVAEDLEVFVNNIQQEPGVGKSYTAAGTTLTFDAAPSSGTANVYVVYRGLAEVTTRLEHDPNAALAATTGTFSGAFTSPGIDDNATSTAMTLDASGNLLVGTTDSSVYNNGTNTSADTGINLNTTYAGFARYNGTPMYVNRTGNDGDIIAFNKSGSTVGSIGTEGTWGSGPQFLGSNSRGFIIANPNTSVNEIIPNVDTIGKLGNSSNRWSDLYLSGGVYLGGTGSANYLDDYEEGTFTGFIYGTISGTGVKANATGDYIKVGNHCTISVYFANANLSSMSGSLKVGGLPFTSTSSVFALYTGSLISYGISFSGFATPYISAGQTSLDVLDSVNGAAWQAVAIPAAPGKYLMVSCTYRTA